MEIRELKSSAQTAAAYLAEQGFEVPHTRVLEALARAIGERNWATLRARLASPQVHSESGHTAEELWLQTGALRAELADLKAGAKSGLVPNFVPGSGPMTEAQFVQYGGGKCPFCGGASLDAEDLEADGPNAWDHTTCEDCGATWKTAFYVSGYYDATPGDPVVAAPQNPFKPGQVLVFTCVDGVTHQHETHVFDASTAWPHLEHIAQPQPNRTPESIAQVLGPFEAECMDALQDAGVEPLYRCNSVSAATSHNSAVQQAKERGLAVQQVWIEGIVESLVDDVRRRQLKHHWSVNTEEAAFDAVMDSGGVFNLRASTADLVEAARRLANV